MSRIYSSSAFVGGYSSSVAGPICDLESSAIESPALLALDFSLKLGTSTSSIFGLGAASNTPVAIGSQGFLPYNPSDPICTSVLATEWSTAPAVPANFFRIFNFTNNHYALFTFTFPRGLKLQPSSSLVLWSIQVNNTVTPNITMEIEL